MGIDFNPRLWPALIYGGVAVGGYAMLQGGASVVARSAGHGLALLGALLATITIVVYIGARISDLVEAAFRAARETKASVLARQVQGLTQEQLRAMQMILRPDDAYWSSITPLDDR